MSARDNIHDRIHGVGYCDPPCGLCREVADLLDTHKDEVLRETADMILDPATWEKYGYTDGTKKQYLILARKVARMIDPGRTT